MTDEIREEQAESLRLPRNWHALVRSAMLQVIGIVRIAMLTGREALIKKGDTTDARIHQLESEVAMLREELRINSARMRRVHPNRRPQYTGLERMAILQLRAMRGWTKSETIRHFLVSDDTIRDWLRRVDDCRTRAKHNLGQSVCGCRALRRANRSNSSARRSAS